MNEIKIYTTGIKFTTQHQNDFQDGFLTKKTLNNTVPTNIATKNIFNDNGRLNKSNMIEA
jgi:hypothetical protein